MRLFLATLFSTLLISQASLAQDYNYINPSTIPPEFLASPIKKGEPMLDAQAEVVKKLQSNATEEELKKANEEAHLTPAIFLKPFGEISDAKKFPRTHELINKTEADCEIITDKAKKYWNTERPFEVDNKIQVLIKKPNSKAYPSGHTACSRIMAEVLGQVLPKEREALRERAAEAAYHRLIVGVHWPQDINGGEQLAMLYFGALQQSQRYKVDLQAAIAENTKPTEVIKPKESAKPVEAAKPAENKKPLEAVKPKEVTKPVEKKEPTEDKKPAKTSNVNSKQ